MNKKIFIAVIVILLIAAGIGAYFVFQKPAFPEPITPPVIKEQTSTFLMVHFEVGGADFPWYKEIAPGADNRNLKYQEALWPIAVKMIEAANSKDFKLTLCFNPQWAEYILKDERKIEAIRQWQNQGHELAFHHHGYDHPDWNGFSNSNDPKVKNDKRYRGRADEGFAYVKKLAAPDKVITGTVTDASNDLPEDILINTYGGVREGTVRWEDAISGPEIRIVKDREIVQIGHGFLESYYRNNQKTAALLEEFKKEYEKLQSGKIFGVVLHEHDFYRYPDAFLQWLDYIDSKGDQAQTVKQIVKENNQTTGKFEDSPFGIFGVFSVFEYPTFLKNMKFAGDYWKWAGKHFQNLGAKWSRQNTLLIWAIIEPELGKGYQWKTPDGKTSVDEIIEAAYQYGGDGFNLILVIEPVRGKGNEKIPPGIKEGDEEYFKNFVKVAVKRYGAKVKYWQAGGAMEPFPDSWIKKGGTIEGYVKFLKLMSEAVKEVDPEAKILMGPQILVPPRVPDGNLDNLKAVISKLNGEKVFDIIDVHYWANANEYKIPHLNELRSFLDSQGYKDVKIWSLEHGTHVNKPEFLFEEYPYQSEKEQSISLVKRYVYNLDQGVSLINWNNLIEWSCFGGRCGGPFDNMGLISDGQNSGETLDTLGVPRLSYYTYKKMTEILEGSDWGNIQTIQESDGVYIYKFAKQGKPIWVAWNDNGAEKQITISGISSSQVKITEAVPKYESGKEVTDYNIAFNTETKTVSAGKITITLKDKPVFVEGE